MRLRTVTAGPALAVFAATALVLAPATTAPHWRPRTTTSTCCAVGASTTRHAVRWIGERRNVAPTADLVKVGAGT